MVQFFQESDFQLKKKNEELLKEVEVIKSDRNLKELEVEKLTQYWGLTRHQLEKEQQELTDMECKLQKMKTAHAEQISVKIKAHSQLRFRLELKLRRKKTSLLNLTIKQFSY